ncbi:PRK06851 family protein [Falsibacillus pallidus]|uniref:PRK06851 family protein n=1 Tax=Falsibacillus pallidus TaxID=493781 RepID=UPI003D9592BC
MTAKIINYYAGGNTARGFHSLFESNLQGLDKLFILKGGPGTGKSSLMKQIGQDWLRNGYNIEFLHCSSDNESIDGVIIPSLKVGIVDGTAPHVIEPKAPGAIEEYVNLGEAWDSAKLAEHKTEIISLSSRITESFQKAYSVFHDALLIHDEWEKIYIENMDFQKANQLTVDLIDELFGKMYVNKAAEVRHRFLGAATPKGPVDFIQNLTEDISYRYFIKGRPGSGKSTLLKKLAAVAEDRGFDVEVYHCGFDPNSLDMVIVRELDFAIFDSTAPHEYFPAREGDEIIDMYSRVITSGTDEIYEDALKDISGRYTNKMKEATAYLAKAKNLHDQLEGIYVSAMDFSRIDRIKSQIHAAILSLEPVKQTQN